MTIVLGIGTPIFGLLCADTRLNLRYADGRIDRNDDRGFNLVRADESVDIVPVRFRKLRRFAWGWAAAGGSSHLLNHAIFEELGRHAALSPSDVRMRVGYVIDTKAPALRAELADAPPGDRVGLIFLVNAAGTIHFGRYVHGINDADPVLAEIQFAILLPPEATPDLVAQLNQMASEDLFVPATIPELLELVRRTARICLPAARDLETVGPIVDVAIVARSTQGDIAEFQVHGDTRELARATDAVLHKALQRLA